MPLHFTANMAWGSHCRAVLRTDRRQDVHAKRLRGEGVKKFAGKFEIDRRILALDSSRRALGKVAGRAAGGGCPAMKIGGMPVHCMFYSAAALAAIGAVGYGIACAIKGRK